MHIVTMIGNQQVGKTALCTLWTTKKTCTSYVNTFFVEHYLLSNLTIYDTPSLERFHSKIESYYASTDVFVLVGNEDLDHDKWWARIRPLAPEASWLFVWTGTTACPKRRKWASVHGITVAYVDLRDVEQSAAALQQLEKLASNHAPRPERVPLGYYEYLVGGARQWIPCV